MIKFFRKIRQKLIAEKRFRDYTTYAVGEILLVVIGILLALQFNNWNIENENDKKEEWYLINIVEDIEYQKGALYDLKNNYEASIQIANLVLKEFEKKESFTKIDSLNHHLNFLMIEDNFPNTNNTYQELVNSGQQTLIQDKELSIDIIDYYLFCEDNFIAISKDNNNIFYKEVHPVFYGLHQTILEEENQNNDIGSLTSNLKLKKYVEQKLNDPENILRLLNGIKTSIQLNQIHLDMVVETIEAGDQLVQEIDNYLGLTPDMVNHYEY